MSEIQKKETDRRFAKFGTVSFTATTKVNDFIDYLEKGQVAGTRCLTCGRYFFPPRIQCHQCLDQARIEWFLIKGTGKLSTYSELKYAPAGFGDDLPYSIAVLDFGDYKVFGRLGKVPVEQLHLGMDLVVQAVTLPNGQLTYVFNLP